MAKLSARGRTCQVETTREYTIEQLTAHAAKHGFLDKDGKPLTTWERVTRRLMSDGKVLEKRDVRFQPDWMDKDGRRYSYGWKVRATLKKGLTAEDYARIYEAPRKDGSPSPWTVTRSPKGIAPARVISQQRILRALQSGDGDIIGFCTACGAEVRGVEPDANGYKCESCGEHAVTGAEELLLQMNA